MSRGEGLAVVDTPPGDERLAQCALVALLTLRGTPILYMGDEIALEDAAVPEERQVDVATPRRDPCRTPLPTCGGPSVRSA